MHDFAVQPWRCELSFSYLAAPVVRAYSGDRLLAACPLLDCIQVGNKQRYSTAKCASE